MSSRAKVNAPSRYHFILGIKETAFKGFQLFAIVSLKIFVCFFYLLLLEEMSSRAKVNTASRYHFILGIKEMAFKGFQLFAIVSLKIFVCVFFIYCR